LIIVDCLNLQAGHIFIAIEVIAPAQAVGVNDRDPKFDGLFIKGLHLNQAAVIYTPWR